MMPCARYEDIACLLISAGCDTSVEDDCGRTGLYHAVKRNRELVIHTLLDRRQPPSLRCQVITTSISNRAVKTNLREFSQSQRKY